MQEKRRTSSPILWISIIGIITSIVLGVLPIFLSQNYSLALLVALVGIAGTLLIDFGVRFTETGNSFSERVSGLEKDMAVLVEREGEDIRRAIKLGEYLARDDELRHTIEQIVNICEEVKSLNVDVFTRKVDEYLRKCYEKVNDLADGEEILDSEFSFLPAEHSREDSVARIVTFSEPHYLDSIRGRKLLDAWEKSIKLKRKIYFIWVQDKQTLLNPKFRKLVQEQNRIGVEVYVAEKESIKDATLLQQQRDFGLIDRRYFYITEIVNGKSDKDNVSNNQEELLKLMEEFHRVDGFAEHTRAYYAQPGQGNTPI